MKGVVLSTLSEPWKGVVVPQWSPNVENVNGASVVPERDFLEGGYSPCSVRVVADEFSWEGSEQDALAFLNPEFITDSAGWRFCHAPGGEPVLRYSLTKFIDGNAE
jgi:hypothetical protein